MLAEVIIWLNSIANAIGSLVLAPVGWMPGWMSATIIAIVTGVLMLLIFKYTSNQSALKRIRARIKANTLALSLFKDDLGVSLRCQARLLGGAGMLLCHSLVPMVVLTVPAVLILGQLALWYQAQPLQVGEESIVTVHLAASENADAIDTIELASSDAVTVVNGPVRVRSKQMVCWNLSPLAEGRHLLRFVVNGKAYEKELVAGGAFQPTSLKRPSRNAGDLLLHPRESPFASDSLVQAIEVAYPNRDAITSGTNNWLIYWFVVSMVAAFAAKPILKVNI